MRQVFRRLWHAALRGLYRGTGGFCPVCATASRRFRRAGSRPRNNAQCVSCGSRGRHRLTWLFLERNTDFFDGRPKTMLHIAPERCFEPRFREVVGDGYLTADLSHPGVMERMDITDIHHPNDSFDIIFCSHVLEHVEDDRAAMAEIQRVLKPEGWAILLVPILAEVTIEDPSVVEPAERKRLFGQEDHVRAYGPDYVQRLRDAGFQVEITTVADLAGAEEVISMALGDAAGEIYFCRKTQREAS